MLLQNELRHRGSGAANNSDGTEHVKVDISEETQKVTLSVSLGFSYYRLFFFWLFCLFFILCFLIRGQWWSGGFELTHSK